MKVDSRGLLRECPTVVGMITASLETGGSVDTAIRHVADSGPRLSRELFAGAVRSADSKSAPTLDRALGDRLDSLPEKAEGYRRSVSMCIAASGSTDGAERSRLLRDASDSSLEAVRSMGEEYSASLTFPCMAVFGIGIMVPMVLMSLLPMLSISGMFGAQAVDDRMVILVTLVAIPAGILLTVLRVRSGNPFLSEGWRASDLRYALPLLSALPLCAAHTAMGLDPGGLFLFAVAPAALATLILMTGGYRAESRRRRCERSIKECIFDIGNRMISGENFENATVGSLSSRAECVPVAESLERSYALCRGDIASAVSEAVSPVSPEASSALVDVYLCSERDPEDAGRLGITLGRQYQNQGSTMRALEVRLKSMTDMMFGSAMVFAPMVLGMSVAMLEPLSEIAGYTGMEGTSTVLGLYLVELSLLIALLTSSLGSGDGFCKGLWRFCIMCPISLLVFAVCGSISI